jgi:hypothetical protein
MIGRNYNDDFTVLSLSNTKDSGGAITPDYIEIPEQKGYLTPFSGNEISINEKVTSRVTHLLFCDNTVSIKEADKLLFTSSGKELEVLYILNFDKGRNPHKEVFLLAKN